MCEGRAPPALLNNVTSPFEINKRHFFGNLRQINSDSLRKF